MSQEHEEIKLALELVSGQFEFLKSSRAKLPFAKYKLIKGEIRRNRPMQGCIAINCRDEASFDRIIAIKSGAFDRR